jgi:hypothetical protein
MVQPRTPYKIRGPQTWARIRENYLNGATARMLAIRFDVTEHAIRSRAKREGWRKQDTVPGAPDPVPPDFPPVLPPSIVAAGPLRTDAAHVAEDAVAAADRCLRDGRLDEAARFARIAETLYRAAKAAPWRVEVEEVEGE